MVPRLYSELEGEVIHLIVKELKEVRYIDQIVLSMNGMENDDFEQAAQFFSVLPSKSQDSLA